MSRRLTVVQLLPALQSGGVERSTLEIAAALVAAGHRAIVVSAGGRLLPSLLASGGEHITLDIGRKSPATLRHVLALRALFQRERVVCVSDTVRQYVLQHYPGTDPARLRTIARGIDPAQFPRRPFPDPAARAQLAQLHPALAGNGPLLLLPGRGTRLKGHADALQLLATLRAGAFPDARLWFPGARQAGREAYIEELQAQARVLGVDAAVAFTAPTAQMAQAYAACDLVLQLSRKPEAFGRTVVEALSVGRPVLGWAHGGVGELLAQLQPSGAVAPFDADALAATATGLLRAPPSPPATIPFTLQAMQQQTLDLYAELAG